METTPLLYKNADFYNKKTMEKDTQETETIFRIDKDGVFAMFPYISEAHNTVLGYAHVGQHSSYDYIWCIKTSKRATTEQYESLKKELEGLGYNIKVVSKKRKRIRKPNPDQNWND